MSRDTGPALKLAIRPEGGKVGSHRLTQKGKSETASNLCAEGGKGVPPFPGTFRVLPSGVSLIELARSGRSAILSPHVFECVVRSSALSVGPRSKDPWGIRAESASIGVPLMAAGQIV